MGRWHPGGYLAQRPEPKGDGFIHTAAAGLNLVGQTSILEDCAVLAQAQVFVGNDSGLVHMASAVGIPTLTVFGPTDALRYHPWDQHADWLNEPEGQLEALSGAAVVAPLRLHLERLGVRSGRIADCGV